MIDNRYVQLEYLESSGTQYIDTGVVATSDIGVDFTFQLTSTSSNQRLGVIYDSSGYKRHHLDVGSDGLGYYFDGTVLGLTSIDTKKHHIVLDTVNKTLSFDGTEYSAKGYFTTSLNYWLFRRNSNRIDFLQYINLKLFSFKMYDKGILVRDFVPAKRKSDGVLGMFDKVNNVFYTNKGTGSFTGGKEIKDRFRSRKIPFAYNEISYLESSGTQFILSEFQPTINTDIEVKFGSTSTNTGCWVMGAPTWVGVHYKGTSVGITNSSTAQYQQYTSYNHDGTPITLKLQGDSVYADGNLLGTIQRRAGTLDFALFGYRDTNQGASIRYNGKIYYAKIWDDNTLVRNFIPVVRKIDNVAGMYDTVEGKFYENKGTGAFKTGDEVLTVDKVRMGSGIKGYEFYDYIENTANQRIDTGIKPSANQNYEIRFSLATVGSNGAIFGGRDTQTNKTASLFFLTASKSFRFDRTSQLNVSSGIFTNAGDVFKFECANNVATLTNETTGQSATTTMTGSYNLEGNYPIHLFCVNTAGTDSLGLNGSIYEWKLKENGELVQHLVPAKRLSDNSIGMLDLVKREFHNNTGSGVFTTGSMVSPPSEPKEVQELRLPYNGNKYKFFDYIQSSGTQYIDTGYAFQDDFSWEIDFEDFSQQTTLFGGCTSSDRTAILYNNPPACCPIAGSNGTATPFKFADLTTGRHKVKMSVASNKGSAWLDDVQTHNNVSFSGTYISGTTQAIFADNFRTSVAEHTTAKVYNLKMWQGSVLVRDFIPAQRLSDNAIGMYDKITNTFFENKGTGVFIAGNETKPMMPFWKRYPDVPKEYEVKEYLESDGYAQIDSGITFKQGDKIDMVGRFIEPKHDDGLICMTPWNQGNNSRFMFAVAISGGIESFCMSYNTLAGGSNKVSPYFTPDTEYHRWTYEDLTLTIDDGVSSLTNTSEYPTTLTGTIYLFRRFNGGCKVAIKYYNHWRNGQLIASYVPVMRKSDGTLGLYDIASDKFLENVGTGSFSSN